MVSALSKCFKRSYSLFLYDIDARWPFKMEGALCQCWILFKRAQGQHGDVAEYVVQFHRRRLAVSKTDQNLFLYDDSSIFFGVISSHSSPSRAASGCSAYSRRLPSQLIRLRSGRIGRAHV